MFAQEMQYLQERCKNIEVRINSIGGSVIDGYSIVSAILNSKVPCNTFIDGLAASIAGVIAVAGKKCSMMDYGTLMMHNASGSEDKAMLDLVNGTICTILSNRTSKSDEDIKNMMQQETWLCAKDALSMGIVDEIISSNKKIKVKKESLSNMALIYNQLINPKKMEKVLNILSVTNEDDAVIAIEAVKAENEALKAELEALKAKQAEYDAQELLKKEAEVEALKVKATDLADTLVTEKKITEEEKANVIENLIANFEFVSNVFSKIKVIEKAPARVFDLKNVSTKKGTEDRSEWTIRDWEKKDEKGLAELKNTNEDLYLELFNAFYKKK